jgi:hypothetical protein
MGVIARAMNEPEKLIPLHGGYRKLKSFQVAQLAYDVTVRCCDRYIDKRSRLRGRRRLHRAPLPRAQPKENPWLNSFFPRAFFYFS